MLMLKRTVTQTHTDKTFQTAIKGTALYIVVHVSLIKSYDGNKVCVKPWVKCTRYQIAPGEFRSIQLIKSYTVVYSIMILSKW